MFCIAQCRQKPCDESFPIETFLWMFKNTFLELLLVCKTDQGAKFMKAEGEEDIVN